MLLRLERVLTTIARRKPVAAAAWSSPAGGRSYHSSLYASSDPT